MDQKRTRNHMQAFADEVARARSLVFQVVSRAPGSEPIAELESCTGRLRAMLQLTVARATSDPRIRGTESRLRGPVTSLINRLEAIVDEPDPDRRRVLAAELHRELAGPPGQDRIGPGMSREPETRQINLDRSPSGR